MKSRITLLCAMLFAALLLLSSCSSGGNNITESTKAPAEEKPSPDADTAESATEISNGASMTVYFGGTEAEWRALCGIFSQFDNSKIITSDSVIGG